MQFFEFIFQSVWTFLGAFLLLNTCLWYLFKFFNRYHRHRNIRKCGWPPAHIDADGDFKCEDKHGKDDGEKQ